MKFHGLLFKPDMIERLDDGSKTNTRRIATKHNSKCYTCSVRELDWPCGKIDENGILRVAHYDVWHQVFARYNPGDFVYVKEPHYLWGEWITIKNRFRFFATRGLVRYLDGPPDYVCRRKQEVGWFKRSPLFMPRWAARRWFKITEVRAQMLQDISEEDAVAEGAVSWANAHQEAYEGYSEDGCFTRDLFHSLWNSINAHRPGCSWADNPPVWPLTLAKTTPEEVTAIRKEMA